MQAIVNYTVKPESALENTRLIELMCDEFNEQQYEGLRYAAFKGVDGVTFYHFVMFGEHNPLPDSAGFKAFKSDIAQRYDHSPGYLQVNEVGSYAFHARDTHPLSSRG